MKEPRFRPPACAPPPETSWVLRRAFGPAGTPAAPERPERALDVARRLGLSARVAARLSGAALAAELGEEVARAFAVDAALCAAQVARLHAVAAQVSAVAARIGVPIAWLKHAALRRTPGVATPGRWATDVDLLAPVAEGESLQRALVAEGFVAGDRGYEHQLPALTAPLGGQVEVHRVVLGVRLGGRSSVTFGELRDGGLLCSTAEGFVPETALLAAHAIAHGLGQHGFEPEGYPPMRMVGDLVDLDFGASRAIDPRLCGWIAGAVPAEEVQGLADLVCGLRAGELPRAESRAVGTAGVLLAHFLAGAFDDGYRASLKLRRLAMPLSDSLRPVAVARAAVHALLPSAGETAAIYRPRSRAGLWWRRFLRPLDLLRRGLNAAAAGLRLRGARRRRS